jgi:hypothetical protein
MTIQQSPEGGLGFSLEEKWDQEGGNKMGTRRAGTRGWICKERPLTWMLVIKLRN